MNRKMVSLGGDTARIPCGWCASMTCGSCARPCMYVSLGKRWCTVCVTNRKASWVLLACGTHAGGTRGRRQVAATRRIYHRCLASVSGAAAIPKRTTRADGRANRRFDAESPCPNCMAGRAPTSSATATAAREENPNARKDIGAGRNDHTAHHEGLWWRESRSWGSWSGVGSPRH